MARTGVAMSVGTGTIGIATGTSTTNAKSTETASICSTSTTSATGLMEKGVIGTTAPLSVISGVSPFGLTRMVTDDVMEDDIVSTVQKHQGRPPLPMRLPLPPVDVQH